MTQQNFSHTAPGPTVLFQLYDDGIAESGLHSCAEVPESHIHIYCESFAAFRIDEGYAFEGGVERILGAMPKEGEQTAAVGKTVEEPVIRMECPVGLNDTVRIKAPGFTDMVGTVAEINDEQQKIKVMVEMFGRETPIEVKFTQVEAIE